MVSIPVVPKLSPNHVRIGSRKERLGVLINLDNLLIIKVFYFYKAY